jgi:hypothetical protein
MSIFIVKAFFSFVGYPLPRLFWYSNPEDPESPAIDTTYELTSTSDATQNALVVKTLSRDFFRKTFWCLANNNNVTQPASTNVTVDLKCEFFEFCFKMTIENRRDVFCLF